MTMNVLDWDRTYKRSPQNIGISNVTKDFDTPIHLSTPDKGSLDFYLGPQIQDEKPVLNSDEMGISKKEFSQLIKKWKNENLL